MKLADITPYFHSKSGGIRRYLLEKTKYVQQRGIEHVLIVPGRKRRTYYINSTKVYELPSFPLPLTGGYRFFSSFSEIKEILKVEDPDVVELGGTYQPINHLKSDRYMLSVFYHSDIRADLSLIPAPERLKKALIDYTIGKKLSQADLIITPSKTQEDFLKRSGIENVLTVNLGVDTNVFNPSMRDPYFNKIIGVKEGRFKLLYAGRLSPDKNVDLLFEVFQHLDPTLFHLVVVGDGPARKKVERLSQKLPNLTYLGYIAKKEDLAKIYASCDVFVSTSLYETYGLAFLEAQACGCLLVAFDMELETQPFKEFLVKEPTLEVFYDAIVHACNAVSLSYRETVSSFIRNRFSWESTFDRLFEVYRGFLAKV